MRILKNESLGLIIDMQEKLYPFIYDNELLTKNTNILIEGLKILQIPILVTQQYTKGLGDTIEALKTTIGEYKHYEKISFSCCDDEKFMTKLNTFNKRKNVIIAGIESHVCVLQTTIDLIEKGFIPVIIEDCISSRTLNNKNIAINRMRKEGAIISTYESILFELCRFSGNEIFKAISKLVK
ncbi:MAG: hydrolase [Bacteroidales bacterium]|nr:hydrolase [Bacteroidales bacterium]